MSPLDVMVLGDSPSIFTTFNFGVFMRPLNRRHVDRGHSARQFNNNHSRTKMVNLHSGVRGGIRL